MGKRFSILVAEDDDGHFLLIKKNLHQMGFRNRVERFADGQSILDFLYMRGNGPKRDPSTTYLMVLDIRMPKVAGDEVLRIVKSDEELKDIPVVMLTTSSEDALIDKCKSLGCNAYVVKPMLFKDFEGALHEVGLSLLLSVLGSSDIEDDNAD